MAADDTHEFLTPPDSDGASLPAQTRDFDGRRGELGFTPPEGGVANPAAAQPIEKTVPLSERLPSFKLLAFDSAAACTAVDVEVAKIKEIMSLVRVPPSSDKAQREALYVKAIDLLESIGPADGIEGMLAVQMVGTHNAAVESLRRAMIYDQSLEAQKVYLSQAERMMGQFTRHLEALDRHRGKGRANITVGQVNVESGGQAIVGNVAPSAGSASPPAIGEPDTQPLIVDLEKPARRKARR